MNQEEKWLLKEKYKGVTNQDFLNDCKRLKEGYPLAFLIGYAPFLSCTIYLDNYPLIPRFETEHWVEKAIKEIIKQNINSPKILDLCAGSGAIGVAVAKAIPDSLVHFVELDKKLLSTIGKNLAENEINCTRYRVWQSDLFENIKDKYDFILSNPPYIDKKANTVEQNVEKYEPHLALFGGEDGLAIIEKIISKVSNYLNPNGQLWLEHEPAQSQAIHDLAEENGLVCSTHNDQYGTKRYSILVLK